MSSPTRAHPLIFVAAAVVCIAAGWYLFRGDPDSSDLTPPHGVELGPIEVVAEKPALSAGSDIRVYWRVGAAAYTAWFEVTASAGAEGRGGVTGEQIFARLEQLEVPGKVVKASVREPKPLTPITDPSVPTKAVVDSTTEDYGAMVRRDAQGRSVMFLDLELGPPDPEPDE